MDSLQASRIIGGNATYKRASSDFYPTPPDVTFVLMKVLGLLEGTKILGTSLWRKPYGLCDEENGISSNRNRYSIWI